MSNKVESLGSSFLGWIFQSLFLVRLLSVVYNNISDCDETYNYWEPTHFLIYGHGFQTWEYSPVYAIRSYAYILIHALPASVMGTPSKLMKFTVLRVLLGLMCAMAETYFYRAVQRKYGRSVSRWLLFFLVPSCGMFISSTAFLPSSFTMYTAMVATAAWFDGSIFLAIFMTALGALVGWPFAALIGFPLAVDVAVVQKKPLMFIVYSALSFLAIAFPLVVVDSLYYGRLVLTPLNIIMYNVLGGGGPGLYGTEPFSYYFINGFLNFNVVFLLALVAWPCVELKVILDRVLNQSSSTAISSCRAAMAPLLLWIGVFIAQPHKEERFLFPIYPLLCLAAALCMCTIKELTPLLTAVLRSFHSVIVLISKCLPSAVIVVYTLLSVSRILALVYGYRAPIQIYTALSSPAVLSSVSSWKEVRLCVGKEWHRFPNSFFLPNRWRLEFIRSDFKGQLPQQFSSLPGATALVPDHMNDLNKEEPSRYVDVSQCHFMVDLDVPRHSTLEPRYSLQSDVWQVVASHPFLDTTRSHPLFRAFFIPFLSHHYTKQVNYVLMRNKRPHLSPTTAAA